MKIWLLAFILIACGTVRDSADLTVWRVYSSTVHADTTFTEWERSAIIASLETWREATSGNVTISVVFDVDFDSIESLREEHAVTVLRVPGSSGVIRMLDGRYKTKILGVTRTRTDGTTDIRLVYDRLGEALFQSVATHEFGHLIGLPDLETYGDVMSGVNIRGFDGPTKLTDSDLSLCQKFRYCQ